MSSRPDFVESLGALTYAHRLKRMMQRLLDEAADVHEALGLPIKPRWVSTLLLLEAESPLTVTEVAERLQLSHPAVVQSLDDMAGLGLVERGQDERDGRRRALSLSAKGRRWMPALHQVWGCLAEVQAEIFSRGRGDLVRILDRANAALEEKSLTERVLAALEQADYQGPPGGRSKKREKAAGSSRRKSKKEREKTR